MGWSDLLDACDAVGRLARDLGIGLLDAQDEALDGRHVTVAGRRHLNFTSCSYLGLELDARLREGAIEATRRFGTQFSVSRAFLSAPPYTALEEALRAMTSGRVLVTPSTTAASAAALPSLVGEDDAVLLDHQVHMTVQLVLPQLQRLGVPVEMVRHGRLDRLEERLLDLRDRHRRVWFLLDGVYSMHGDLAPLDALALLLDRHESLHLYVDDAHGTSWTGRHGRGHALERLPERERVVTALSLNKSFAAAGGALVLPDERTEARVRHTAAPLLFGGPLQPPMLGAALASARVHLSDEIDGLQEELRVRIRHANRRAIELDLPLLHPREVVPIRFVELGPRPASVAMARHLMDCGLLTSCALFPAVPAHRTGIRFSLTRHQELRDIDLLLERMAAFLPEARERGGVARPAAVAVPRPVRPGPHVPLRLAHHHSIAQLDAAEWDRLLGGRGSFDAGGLRTLEEIFGPHQKPENHWRFHYHVVRDGLGAPVLSSFFTEASMKDDMFAPRDVSREVERRRRRDPGYLTSRVLTMGSPLTEGDHLWLARERAGTWRDALHLLTAHVDELAEAGDASLIAYRDLPDDPALDEVLLELGFVRLSAPDSMVLEIDWASRDEYLSRLSKRARRFQRERVEPYDDAYDVGILRPGDPGPPPGGWMHLYRLYRNVHRRALELNTFPLPEDLLPRMMRHPGWEIVTLRLREGSARCPRPQAFFAARIANGSYVPILAGLDYAAVREHGAYRQCLAWMLRRARALGLRRLLLGPGAALEKRRLGAVARTRHVWVKHRDGFGADVLASLAAGVRVGPASPSEAPGRPLP